MESIQNKNHEHEPARSDERKVKKQKRGMKPRSKRNRKRARSNIHSIENISYKTHVKPLAIGGKLIESSVKFLRTVEPYPYTFSTFAKARWLGRSVLDVYSTEFGSYPELYYKTAIIQGRILISDQVVDPTYIIKGGDVLTHTVHRHEPAVAVNSQESPYVKIIEETNDVLVVDKPGTLPIHPCGGYHIQSLMNLLEPHFGKLYTIHRLDRLTSGLVILGKTSPIAKQWGDAIRNRNCTKVYLARVKGRFPLNCSKHLRLNKVIASPVNGEWENVVEDESIDSVVMQKKRNAHGWWIADSSGKPVCQPRDPLESIFESPRSENDWIQSIHNDKQEADNIYWFHLACPTRIAKPKDGVCEAGIFDTLTDEAYKKTVKSAETSFGVVKYDKASDSTIVLCRPHTGRTHQIRLHLQYIGHPIANDPNYGGDIWYGDKEGKDACQMAHQKLATVKDANSENPSDPATIDVPATTVEVKQEIARAVRENTESIHDFIKRTCVWCARSQTEGDDRATLEFLIRSNGIWLHAFQYTFEGGSSGRQESFRANLPEWYIQ